MPQADIKSFRMVENGVELAEEPFQVDTEQLWGEASLPSLNMGRPQRVALGGYVYHVLNRGNGRLSLFRKDADYHAFERVLTQALDHVPGMRLLCYTLMPNHWHLVVWPRADGELSDFAHWLTLTLTQRWRAHYHNVGAGHLYQGHFKSFVVSTDQHFLTVCYVERNALRAGLVASAQEWPWTSLCAHGRPLAERLGDWPVPRPERWIGYVNGVESEAELAALRRSLHRGQPYGPTAWVAQTAARLGLDSTLRPRGRPKKSTPLEKGS